MRFILTFIYICLLIIFSLNLKAQNITIKDLTKDESVLYSQTKQVNQFFRRFNSEEDASGTRYIKEDNLYRNNELRTVIIKNLFDNQNTGIPQELKNSFISDLTNDGNPKYLEFHEYEWYAEVDAKFQINKKKENIILFLRLEKENLGSKWVLVNTYSGYFDQFFYNSDSISSSKKFLHPLSHEIDFMNLRKVFDDNQNIEYYLSKDYSPDYLTLFIYEVKNSSLKFKSVNSLKFHFFQIENWYFELSYFNRKGHNSGWLISNLIEIPENEKYKLRKIIYNEKD